MDNQSNLSDFRASDVTETDLYECEICGRTFDSAKGRGIHRGSSHGEDEIKQVLLTEIKRLADELGRTPGLRDMNERGAHSSKTYQKKFASWNDAVREAGLEPNAETDISKSDLIDELKNLKERLGRTPTSRDMANDGEHGSATYVSKFGSWNNAVREAGLEITRERDVPAENLVNEIERVAEKVGHAPTTTQMKLHGDYGVTTYINRFGTWNDAVREAGFEPIRVKNVSKTDLLRALTDLSDELGRTPNAVEMDTDGKYSVGTYDRRFGSWNNALEEAGLDLNNRSNIKKSKLLDGLRLLGDELGRTPRAVDMDMTGPYSASVYGRTFESWNSAIRQAGFEPNVRNDIPKSELISEIQRLENELGHTPQRREMDSDGDIDSTTFMSTFGSWNNALEAAGFDPIRRLDIPNSDLIDEIQRLAETRNRPPTRDEMIYHGDFGWSIYRRRFGSWTDALIEAGYEPHKALNPDHLDHRVDSVPELVVAEILLDAGVEYENEGMQITYDGGRTYTPDFVTEDYVIECKGQDWGEMYGKEVTAKDKAEAAMSALDTREYVVVGIELPADIHIPWEERQKITALFK